MTRLLTCALLSLTASAVAQDGAETSEEVRTFLREWGETMRDVRSLRVEFVQSKKLRMMRRPVESRGTTLMKGRRLKMVVEGEEGRPDLILAVEPGRARLYYPQRGRLEVFHTSADAAPPPSPFPVFTEDVEELPRRYHLELIEHEDQTRTLVLRPRAEDARMREFRMRFRDHRVVEASQVDRRGDSVHMDIQVFEVGAEVDEADLVLEVPPGTEVVHVGGDDAGEDG